MITMFGITLISETVNDRAFVAMSEDVWVLPFLIALYTLPDKPNQWKYFVRCLCASDTPKLILATPPQGIASGLLAFPWVHY